METIQGKAHNIHQHAKLITKHNNLESAYKTVMTVDGYAVSLNTDDAVIINEGDTVIVAGNNRGGTVKAYAYRNLTNGASGGMSRFKYLSMSSLATVIAVPFGWSYVEQMLAGEYTESKAIAFGVGALVAALIGYAWVQAIRSVRAHTAVN